MFLMKSLLGCENIEQIKISNVPDYSSMATSSTVLDNLKNRERYNPCQLFHRSINEFVCWKWIYHSLSYIIIFYIRRYKLFLICFTFDSKFGVIYEMVGVCWAFAVIKRVARRKNKDIAQHNIVLTDVGDDFVIAIFLNWWSSNDTGM